MIPELCPFCKQPATFALIASNDYELTCPTCEIKVEITQVAALIQCPHPEIVLEYIRQRKDEPKKAITSDDMLSGDGPSLGTEEPPTPVNE
jgi:hypothetical protein